MNHASLFSGIGGFDLAAQWMGWENVFSCEINPFGKKILEYYWPNTTHYDDIKTTDFTIHRGGVDIITGGFPCQPFSLAGKRKGTDDDRHLWPRMLEVIRDVQPIWVVGENVYGLVNWDGGLVFNQVQVDLEALGYEVQSVILPACSVNAPHRRDRIWIVAYSESLRINREEKSKDCCGQGGERRRCDINDSCKVRQGDGDETTPHPNSNGLNRSNSEHEKQSGKGGVNALNDTEQNESRGSTPDTEDIRCRETKETQRERGECEQKGCKIWETSNEYVRCGTSPDTNELRGREEYELQQTELCEQFSKKRITPKPSIQRCNNGSNNREERYIQKDKGVTSESKSERKGWKCGVSKIGSDVTNPTRSSSKRKLSDRQGKGESGGCDSTNITNWEDFPTQPPLCGRDDGLSARLDGITFPKWRNESIKGYGNAIVPQVVYQIFKAIESIHEIN